MMKQLSIFMENKKGRLSEVLALLAEFQVDLRALSLADSKDYGVLRIIVAEPEATAKKLRERGVVVALTTVWVIKVPDQVGGLAGVLSRLVAQDVEVEYMYAFVEKEHELAQVVFRVKDNEVMEKAMQTLEV